MALRGLRLTPSLTATQPVVLAQRAFQRQVGAMAALQFQQHRMYASNRDQQGKQVLIRDHGVFGKCQHSPANRRFEKKKTDK